MNEKELKVDKKNTIKVMKGHLNFLKKHVATYYIHNALYGGENQNLQVEEDICEYLQYTKNVVNNSKSTNDFYYNPILDVMEQQKITKQRLIEEDKKAYFLLQGVLHLKKQERELLMDLYVRGLERQLVLRHQGDIVNSTLDRRIQRACLHLAELLSLQIYES